MQGNINLKWKIGLKKIKNERLAAELSLAHEHIQT